MKILVVVDEYPFPPRNGVTIPTAGIISALNSVADIDILLIESDLKVDIEIENNIYVKKIYRCTAKKINKISGVYREIFKKKPAFGYKANNISPIDFFENRYDVIIASPISVVEMAKKINYNNSRIIAAISDVYTSVLMSRSINDGLSLINRNLIKYRAKNMMIVESKILEDCSCVFVQTKKDVHWLNRISKKINYKIITNGVNDDIFKIKISDKKNKIIMIANYSDPLYKNNLEWFIDEVWSKLNDVHENYEFHVFGKGINENDYVYKKLNGSIKYRGFVKDICEVYCDALISVAPIYKDYGFINKVAESIAAGVVVVGDNSAFNGIEGCVDNGYGFVAENPGDYIFQIRKILSDLDKLKKISMEAQLYGREVLSWNSKKMEIINAVNELL